MRRLRHIKVKVGPKVTQLEVGALHVVVSGDLEQQKPWFLPP